MSRFRQRSILSIRDMDRPDLIEIIEATSEVKKGMHGNFLEGSTVALLFFEPSTRTRLSFESAVLQKGGRTLGFGSPEGSSQSKGESFADTVRTVTGYCSAMVMRHPVEGAPRYASEVASVPVVNAGDGANQHPTQTFLDLFTMHEHFGDLQGLHIGLMGDLKYGRTVHSLATAMAMFDADLTFISPTSLRMPAHLVTELETSGIDIREVEEPEEAGTGLDVLYVTRIQRERFGDPQEYESVAHCYRVTGETIGSLGDEVMVMHPLPRLDEIAEEVDLLPNAMYFRAVPRSMPDFNAAFPTSPCLLISCISFLT